MRVEKLSNNRIKEFINYCKKYRDRVDDSFLYDEELNDFRADEINPTYLLVENNNIVGVGSLMLDLKYRKGRFRILHTSKEIDGYKIIFKKILEDCMSIDRIYIFIPLKEEETIRKLKSLNYNVERYAFLLERRALDIPEYSFSSEYELREFKFGRDEEDFCKVRNAGFSSLLGFTPITEETVSQMSNWDDHLEGGIFLLYHDDEAIGVVRTGKDLKNDEYYTQIGSLSVVPEYQGQGIGKNLLRLALSYGKSKGMNKAILSVNGENENAIRLYKQEGFKEEDSFVCLNYSIRMHDSE
ncbi:MAG: GNAT family N-acetyltransferase [Firmicutes bacterium]|nr:GNAT family N-acetyltransferase [Bacillota bacterium]